MIEQNGVNSVEREENYVPRTRKDYGLPAEKECQPLDYREIFEDTPIYSLGRMLLMQLLGWQVYLLQNTLGNPMYPPGTNVSSPRLIFRASLTVLCCSTFPLLPRFSSRIRNGRSSRRILDWRSWHLCSLRMGTSMVGSRLPDSISFRILYAAIPTDDMYSR